MPDRRVRDPGDDRRRLDELSIATKRRVSSLMNSFDGIVEAATDVATDDEHDPEGHTIAWERQQIAALLDEARAALTDIEAAGQRLEVGLYGTCTTCRLEISADRLDALPATPTCVGCAPLLRRARDVTLCSLQTSGLLPGGTDGAAIENEDTIV